MRNFCAPTSPSSRASRVRSASELGAPNSADQSSSPRWSSSHASAGISLSCAASSVRNLPSRRPSDDAAASRGCAPFSRAASERFSFGGGAMTIGVCTHDVQMSRSRKSGRPVNSPTTSYPLGLSGLE